MRILACSHRFPPDIGGIETTTVALASAWRERGHEVTIVTRTPGGAEECGLRVERNPSALRFAWLAARADVVWHNNVSLPWLIAPALLARPLVITHQTWLTQPDGVVSRREKLKRLALRVARQIAISRAVREHVALPGTLVVHNPFGTAFAGGGAAGERAVDLAFVGRLVSDKGLRLLAEALEHLEAGGVHPTVAVVGDGPERAFLEGWIGSRFERASRVRLLGALPPASVAATLRCARVLVVPSVWEEPFGIVALEGLAAGCRVVASDGGGLPDAVGACGLLFRRGDTGDLARVLRGALDDRSRQDTAAVAAHLRAFSAEVIAGRYLALFQQLVA